MSFPFTKRYAVHLLPADISLSPTFATFKRADTGANVSAPSISEVGGSGNGQGWYYWDWLWNGLTDPDIVYTFEGTSPYDPSTAWLDSLSAIDVVSVTNGPAANRIYEFHYQPTDTGLTPSFSLCKRLDTGANVTPPSITEIGGGFYRFIWPFAGASDPDVVFLINGNYPSAIDPSKAWYGIIQASDQYASANVPLAIPGLPIVVPNPLAGLPSSVDFGQDFDFLNQLDPNLGLVSGLANLGQALAHRLETPRGGLFYDGDYGTDVRGRLNDAMSPAGISRLSSDVNAECLKDERVLTCSSYVQFVQATSNLSISINCGTAAGPFQLILAVDDVSVSLLDSTANASA